MLVQIFPLVVIVILFATGKANKRSYFFEQSCQEWKTAADFMALTRFGSLREEVWSPHITAAFDDCVGLLHNDAKSRQLSVLCGTNMGINNAISLCCFHLTGEYRSRKQVSSHKQVLRSKKILRY